MRVTAWIVRFIRNSQAKKASRIKGPLSTPEIQEQITQWVKRVQSRAKSNDSFKEDEQKLNIQKNDEGILECRGRIQGQCPIYLPSDTLFTEKLVMDSHISTGHGGVSMTMSSVRERFWVPRLRKLVKKLRFKTNEENLFGVLPLTQPAHDVISTLFFGRFHVTFTTNLNATSI
eukprot:gene4175-20362_t